MDGSQHYQCLAKHDLESKSCKTDAFSDKQGNFLTQIVCVSMLLPLLK